MFDDKITQADIDFIAHNMRDADRAEVTAASGLTPVEVLEKGVELSWDVGVFRGREPVFIAGVVDPGVIWLLGTDAIVKHRHYLHKLAKHVLTCWHYKYPTLGNIVDARNTVHIRWLKAMGFTFGEPITAGVAQIPFIPFSRTVPHV